MSKLKLARLSYVFFYLYVSKFIGDIQMDVARSIYMNTVQQLVDVKIGQIMTQQVVTLMIDDTIQDAAGVMLENNLSTVPVIDVNNKCIGILSRTDMTELFLETDDELAQLLDTDRLSLEWYHRSAETSQDRRVREFMVDNVSQINVDSTLQEACREMARNRVHHLPVIDNNERVVGIVSTFDIVNAIANLPDRG